MNRSGKAPVHLWVIGIVATLWNGFGCFDYLMTQTRNEAYLAQFSPEIVAYIEAFPAWSEAAWALGVWGGLAGSLLLLARSRYAVGAYIVSLIGLAATTVYQFLLSTPPSEMASGEMIGIQAVIWVVAVGLLVYALRMRRKGVLR